MNRGFTLIELIVVIAIIAILSAIIAPNAFKAVEKAKVVEFCQDYKTVKGAMYSYYADTGKWPGQEQAITTCLITNTGNVAGWDGPYIERIPRPPWNPDIWVATTWLRWRWWTATISFFCYENGQTPPVPLPTILQIDQVLDGGDGPTTGDARGRESLNNFNQFCFWLLAKEE